MIFTQGYYHALDRTYPLETIDGIEQPMELSSGDKAFDMDIGPQEIGTSLNPFQHQLEALNAKIKEGASKVEFEFFGAGKGRKDAATPESFDKEERREMRELAELNEVRSSTHATVGITGLAGFDAQRGFEEQSREQNMREVKKAIDFAAEATTGGAIVLHTGEWNRPIYDYHGNEEVGGEIYQFLGYPNEEEKAQLLVVDKRTGEFVRALRKDTPVYEPVFKTIKDYEEETGKKLVGTRDKDGNLYEADDWIGGSGEVVKRDWEFAPDKAKKMFRRVPWYNPEETNFKTIRRKWDYFQEKSEWWNKRHPDMQLTPEEIFAKIQFTNQALQAKGSSLYHGRFYEREKEVRDAALESLKFYEKLNEELPEDEKWKLMMNAGYYADGVTQQLLPPKNISIPEHLRNVVNQQEQSMRYTHEASAAADVQATQAIEVSENVQTVKDYGLEKTAESLAELGITTWQKYEQNKDKLKDTLYIAPENLFPLQFGSHPDELLEMIEAGRSKMVERLTPSMGVEKARELSEKHIKTTLDTGHLNMWKSHLRRKTDKQGNSIESDEDFNKRFANWAVEKVKKLHEANILGHIHITDNFGWDDEHLMVGKGNAPNKEIMEFLTKKGYKDFIAEPGSFNAQTVLPEAWSQFGSPVYGVQSTNPGRFSHIHKQAFGYQAPPFYIVGAYSPSNEWKLWSEVPLE